MMFDTMFDTMLDENPPAKDCKRRSNTLVNKFRDFEFDKNALAKMAKMSKNIQFEEDNYQEHIHQETSDSDTDSDGILKT